MSLNYGQIKYYFVPFAPTTSAPVINYIWGSNALDGIGITTADLTTLGITEIADDRTNVPATGVFKVNSPKPPRVRKVDTTNGNTTTFCGTAEIGAAVAAEFDRVSRVEFRNPILASAGKKKQTVYVTVGGVKFAWDMLTSLYTKISADLTGLGITAATAADAGTLVYGATAPYPAKATKLFPDAAGSGFDKVTTFCGEAAENSLPAGWTIKQRRLTVRDFI